MLETNQTELLKSICSFLEKNKIRYMITGAWSVIYYARPRASHDIDFIVEINKNEIDKAINTFKKLSTDEYIISLERIREAIAKKDMFHLLHLPTMLKLDFWLLTEEPFDQARFERKKKIKLLGQPMCIASAEDTILKKLLWYKNSKIEKHLIDAAFVYQIQKKNLYLSYLNKWSKNLKVADFLKDLAKIDLKEYL